MKLAVFSDVHSNHIALQTCLRFADHLGADAYAFLGDHLTDCPDPEKTLALLYESRKKKPCWFLRGNREDYLLQHHANPTTPEWRPSAQYGSLLYTYQRLTEEDFSFLRSMPQSGVIELEDCPRLAMCHSTPSGQHVSIFPGTEAADILLRKLQDKAILLGHSHMQFRYEAYGRQMINPGSVGMPAHGNRKAQFAMLTCENDRWNARMLNIDYDTAALLHEFDESGLMETAGVYARMIRMQLAEGKDLIDECIRIASQYAKQDGSAELTDYYWELAAKDLRVL